MDNSRPIDTNKGINGDIFFGMADMYYESLATMEEGFNKCITEMKVAYDTEDYKC